jgi:hypothetical protein
MQPIYLICGVPGSGKTHCCLGVKDHFDYVPQEKYITKDRSVSPIALYKAALMKAARESDRPVMGEVPFMISIMIQELQQAGHDVRPVFVIEPEHVVKRRYEAREKKPIPKGHLTRVATVRQRALNLGIFYGSSDDVLSYLHSLTKPKARLVEPGDEEENAEA